MANWLDKWTGGWANSRGAVKQFEQANTREEDEDTLKKRLAKQEYKVPEKPLVLSPEALKGDSAPQSAPEPAKPTETLQQKIQASAKSSDPAKAGAELMSKSEKKEAIDDLVALNKDPRFQHEEPGYDKQSLQAAIDRARQLYKEESTRNEWLEVAQMLARAGAQFGAATSGAATSGRADLSNLNLGPGIDYQGRTERARKDYSQELDNINRDEDRRRQSVMDSNRTKDVGYGREKDVIDMKSRSEESEASRRSAEKIAGIRTAKDDNDDWRDKQLAFSEWKEEVKNTAEDLKAADQLAKDRVAAAALIAQLDDASPKSIQKLEQQSHGILGKAGITPAQIQAINDKATEKGLIWDKLDSKKRNELIQEELIKPAQDEVRNLRQSLDLLKKQRSQHTKSPDPAAGSEQKQQTMSREQLAEYAKTHKMSEADAEKYLNSQGFVVK